MLDQLHFLDHSPFELSSHRSRDSWLPVFDLTLESFPLTSKVGEVDFSSDLSIHDGVSTSFLNNSQSALSDNLLGH